MLREWVYSGVYLPTSNENFEVMIYTGLKDYHGREVYEGDIVSCNDLVHESDFLCEVKFLDGRFVVINDLLKEKISLFEESLDIEIVGNIYENTGMLEMIRKNKINVCYQCRNEDISEDARYCKICGIGLRVMELVSVFNFETGEEVYSFLTGKECLIDFGDLREDNPCKLFFENAELRINGVKSFYQDERGIFIKDDEYSYRIIFKDLEW
ncbi:YopX protein [Clostridioides difficile]|nr:YopX protein [Clostridioides difficile]SJW03622.1 YopX protein [Clostridioides difficile]SJW26268.1 YopX protein [Clostridioides difficile]